MAADFRAGAISDPNSSAVSSVGIVVPATAVAGDVARIVLGCTVAAASLTVPSGWTLLSGPDTTTNMASWVLAKTLVSGDIGATVTLAITGGTGRMSAQMNVYSGVTLTGSADAVVIETSSNSDVTLPSIASVPAGALVDAAAAQRISTGTAPDVSFGAPYSQGANPRHGTTSGSSNMSTEGAYRVVSTSGTYGGEVFTLVTGTSTGIAYLVTFPATGGGGGAAPVANFTGTPLSGAAPLTVTFTDTSTNTPTSWSWNFGDGGTSTSQNPSRQYTSPGTYNVTLTATNANGSDGETKTGYVVVSAGSTAPDTPTLLARLNKTTPTGTFTDKWVEASPTTDRTYDFRGARFEGYFWADAIFGYGTFDNGAGGTNATAHQKNITPFLLGESGKATRAAIIGGVVTGDQSPTLSWNSMKHGQWVQDNIDGGMTGDEAYALIPGNNNQDGDPRIYLSQGTWCVVDGLRTRHTHDGFGIYTATGAISDTGTQYMRNCWISEVHDDAIENDRGMIRLEVDDCLFENIHSFLSCRPSIETGTPDQAKPQIIRDSVLTFKARPGPHKEASSVVKHGAIYKSQANSPPLQMTNVIIGVSAPASTSQLTLPTFTGCSYTGVTIVWTGSGAYPGNVPAGVTVSTSQALLDDAVSDWKGRHGVSSFDTVDMALMIAPLDDPPAGVNGIRIGPTTPLAIYNGPTAVLKVYNGPTLLWP